jgi:hypothetical protein
MECGLMGTECLGSLPSVVRFLFLSPYVVYTNLATDSTNLKVQAVCIGGQSITVYNRCLRTSSLRHTKRGEDRKEEKEFGCSPSLLDPGLRCYIGRRG